MIGGLVQPDASCEFWEHLAPDEIAWLLNEWLLHQKYRELVSDVGEKKLNRAKDVILTEGLGPLRLHSGRVKEFMPLKLSDIDLDAVGEAIPDTADTQTSDLIGMLRRPYGEFFDFDQPYARNQLASLCSSLQRPLPGPQDR